MSTFLGTPLLLSDLIESFSDPVFVVDFVLSVLVVLLVSFFMCFRLQRAWVYVGYITLDAMFICSLLFKDLRYLPFVSIMLFTILTITCLFINSGLLRKYLAKSLKSSSMITTNNKQVYDKEKFIQDVITAVNWLSENKVGALITFEKDTPLDDYMKNGTMINCPFTPEIVETIFYEGTRLHDGAIIIKKDSNIISAAAVYYPPSTKVLPGKFGARHRAALGISEVTDSVTIVVSEETGRIAIAHGGLLDRVKTDEFEKILRTQIMA